MLCLWQTGKGNNEIKQYLGGQRSPTTQAGPRSFQCVCVCVSWKKYYMRVMHTKTLIQRYCPLYGRVKNCTSAAVLLRNSHASLYSPQRQHRVLLEFMLCVRVDGQAHSLFVSHPQCVCVCVSEGPWVVECVPLLAACAFRSQCLEA